MVAPEDVPRILTDAARLVGEGELVVFGSAALAYWLEDAPRSRDVDLWCDPAERGDVLVALMGELSWYHERHGVYVEVWAPETFAAPVSWRRRAKELELEAQPGVRLIVPHPHDVLMAKLERGDPQDRDHWQRILRQYPLAPEELDRLCEDMPHRRGAIDESERLRRFEHGLDQLRVLLARTES